MLLGKNRSSTMTKLEDLANAAKNLAPERLSVLIEMANALKNTHIEQSVNPESDIMSEAFSENFTARLLIYHALHATKMSKKTFEYAFQGALEAAGKTVVMTENSVHAGADLIVDGVNFSLKTQAEKKMSRTAITISKLMEARWIRECQNGDMFLERTLDNVIKHLNEYKRIIMLRAFKDEAGPFEYDLIEVPLTVLKKMENLEATDFTQRTKNGSSTAKVKVGEQSSFNMRLDGSVEKVTISSLPTSLCILHSSWSIRR